MVHACHGMVHAQVAVIGHVWLCCSRLDLDIQHIWCRLCQGCGASNGVLLAALGGQLPGRTVMLQASGSFFAYEPILRALQTRQPMPLAHYIADTKLKPDARDPARLQTRPADRLSILMRMLGRSSGTGRDPCLISHYVSPFSDTKQPRSRQCLALCIQLFLRTIQAGYQTQLSCCGNK